MQTSHRRVLSGVRLALERRAGLPTLGAVAWELRSDARPGTLLLHHSQLRRSDVMGARRRIPPGPRHARHPGGRRRPAAPLTATGAWDERIVHIEQHERERRRGGSRHPAIVDP